MRPANQPTEPKRDSDCALRLVLVQRDIYMSLETTALLSDTPSIKLAVVAVA
jgi:hypothetical protein